MAKYKIIPSSRTIVQSPISIGHKAEKGVEAIEFDLTAWVETYGSGTLTVIMRRWGDAIPYPIALEIDENNKATWTLSDIDTAKAGMAYAQLSYIVGETVVKKSDIYTFRVMDSLVGEGEPPEAYESWLEHLTHFAAEAMAEVLDIEGIVTDKTLSVDGGIADAKATGDALALKADQATTYTKTEVDGLIEDVTVETDTTLEIAGAAADAKKTGDELTAIKADLDDVNERIDDIVPGLSEDAKTALLACFQHIAFLDDDDDYYTNLRNALSPEWGADYDWLYKADTDGLLSENTNFLETTHSGDSVDETIRNGVLNIHSDYTNNYNSLVCRLLPNTSTGGYIKAKVRFNSLPYATSVTGFRVNIANSNGGAQLAAFRHANDGKYKFITHLGQTQTTVLDDISLNTWYVISCELNGNSQIIKINGTTYTYNSLSTLAATENRVVFQEPSEVSGFTMDDLDVDVAWISFKDYSVS